MQRMYWFILAWMWLFFAPHSPLLKSTEAASAQGGTCSVVATPTCAHKPGDYVTFTYSMNTGNTTYFVATQDMTGVTLVMLQRGSSDTRFYYINVGVGSYRLHPKGWCKGFTVGSKSEAEALANTAQGEVAHIQSLVIDHSSIRATIETLEQSLITAIEANDIAVIESLKTQIGSLEANDDSILQQIQSHQTAIQNAYGEPPRDDAGILELDMLAFRVNDEYEVPGTTLPPTNAPSTAQVTPDIRRYILVDDASEESPGLPTWTNDDDDDLSATPDKEDAFVSEEDDLAIAWWFFAKPLAPPLGVSDWNLTIDSDSSFKFWNERTKYSQRSLPVTISEPYHRNRLFIEATTPSVADLAESVSAEMRGAPPCMERFQAVALGIVSIVLEPGPAGANLETAGQDSFARIASPPLPTLPGGEHRLFPCKNTPTGPRNDTIEVLLTITPPRDQVVWVRSVDVDDPSTSLAPIDRDPDGASGGGDNRIIAPATRRAGLLKSLLGGEADDKDRLSVRTNGNGWVRFRFDVSSSMQPGNNFRILAGFTKSTLVTRVMEGSSTNDGKIYDTVPVEGLFFPIPENINPPAERKQSPLLTIWRKLHLELDSMSIAAGNVAMATGARIRGTHALELVNISHGTEPGDSGPLDALNGGRFSEGFMSNWVLDESLRRNTEDAVSARNALGQGWLSRVFIFDGDDFAVLHPDLGTLQDSYNLDANFLAAAYIQPVPDGGGDPANNDSYTLPFVMNVHNDNTHAVHIAQQNLGRKSAGNNAPDFWVGYVQAAFQPDRRWDRDPNDERRNRNASLASCSVGENPGILLWYEFIREEAELFNEPFPRIYQDTIVHEMGHTLDGDHGDGGVMGNARGHSDGFGLKYAAPSLVKFRSIAKPVCN